MTSNLENLAAWLPERVNTGTFATAYTHPVLSGMLAAGGELILPVCSLGTPAAALAELGELVLPPLYREALEPGLEAALVRAIDDCLPYCRGTTRRAATAVTVRAVDMPATAATESPRDLAGVAAVAFSIDTAVEEHGPHLPLATDRIQSYSVLTELCRECPDLYLAPPLDYGELTWGLPLGLSVNITAPLLKQYAVNYLRAVQRWTGAKAVYLVAVHGSLVHRETIAAAVAESGSAPALFRWLYEPLFSDCQRTGDAHAGGIETAVIETIAPALVDEQWFPRRLTELADGQGSLPEVLDLAPDFERFQRWAAARQWNGIVGDIRCYDQFSGGELHSRMVDVASRDLASLL